MLLMNFRDPVDLPRAIALAERTATATDARTGVEVLLNLVGVRSGPGDENYFQAALDYYLGQAYAAARQPERAIELIDRSGVLPASGGPVIFETHVAWSVRLSEQMMAARERGLPSLLIASMPRAASASLTQSIAALLDAPVMRVTIGADPYYVVPRWLNHVSPGGAVLHDHFDASVYSRRVLREAGVKSLFVLVRDPRAAAYSNATLHKPHGGERRDAAALHYLETWFAPWLASWVDAERSGDLHVEWLWSATTRADLPAVWRRISDLLVRDYPALKSYAGHTPAILQANYRYGDDDRWRREIAPAVQERMWAAIPSAVAEKFELVP